MTRVPADAAILYRNYMGTVMSGLLRPCREPRCKGFRFTAKWRKRVITLCTTMIVEQTENRIEVIDDHPEEAGLRRVE